MLNQFMLMDICIIDEDKYSFVLGDKVNYSWDPPLTLYDDISYAFATFLDGGEDIRDKWNFDKWSPSWCNPAITHGKTGEYIVVDERGTTLSQGTESKELKESTLGETETPCITNIGGRVFLLHNGFYEYSDEDGWISIPLPREIKGNRLKAVDGSSQEDIYIVEESKNLWHFNNLTKKWTHLRDDLNEAITWETICYGEDGLIYIGGRDGYLVVGKDDTWQEVKLNTSKDIKKIVSYQGEIFVGFIEGTYTLKKQENNDLPFILIEYIFEGFPNFEGGHLLYTAYGKLIVGNYSSHVVVYDGKKWKDICGCSYNEDLKGNEFKGLEVKNGRIYEATVGKDFCKLALDTAVVYISLEPYSPYSEDDIKRTSSSFTAICGVSEKDIYLIEEDSKLWHFNLKKDKWTPLDIEGISWKCFLLREDGTLYIGGEDGNIAIKSGDNWKVVNVDTSKDIESIVTYQGDIWIGTTDETFILKSTCEGDKEIFILERYIFQDLENFTGGHLMFVQRAGASLEILVITNSLSQVVFYDGKKWVEAYSGVTSSPREKKLAKYITLFGIDVVRFAEEKQRLKKIVNSSKYLKKLNSHYQRITDELILPVNLFNKGTLLDVCIQNEGYFSFIIGTPGYRDMKYSFATYSKKREKSWSEKTWKSDTWQSPVIIHGRVDEFMVFDKIIGALYQGVGKNGKIEKVNTEWGWFGLNCAANIDGTIFTGVNNRRLYKRNGPDDWDLSIPDPIDIERREGFHSIDGFSKEEIYGVGGDRDIYSYNSVTDQWKYIDIDLLSRMYITTVCCGEDGVVYIGGRSGKIAWGRKDSWHHQKLDLKIDIKKIVSYMGKIFVGADEGTYILTPIKDSDGNDKFKLEPYIFEELPSFKGGPFLYTAYGMMIVGNYFNQIAYHDGEEWINIHGCYGPSLLLEGEEITSKIKEVKETYKELDSKGPELC